ncbi:helix-turn-helix domain-containing protein [Bradyrhizobium sp. B124]|uniref:LexA family protein n=1 Tax=Bradyrhizobium sp. B124 TaxID=3140245 RepID=UPI00318348D2
MEDVHRRPEQVFEVGLKTGTYAYMFGRPPAEADIQRHFRVSPPSVHQMIVTLERNGFIRRQPGVPRRIEILVPPESLPILEWLGIKTSKSLW